MSGPLTGVRVVELAGLGAAPYGCMMLADMGAEVVRIERPSGAGVDTPQDSPVLRNRRSLILDLKRKEAVDAVLAMVEKADILVEGFRPGVTERLGLGPDICLARNEKLVYGRITGWGQDGPLAQAAGHDLNYLALSGMLKQIGPTGGKPVVPLNVIGDYGGGGLLMAFGVVCALFEARQSGKGQVVDAAMIDGALSFMALYFGYRDQGQFFDQAGSHMLGGGAHYYNVYETQDGGFLSVAPLEPNFYLTFIEKLGLDKSRYLPTGYPAHTEQTVAQDWPALKTELAEIFKTRSRDQWCELFKDSDVCVFPVLSMDEAVEHPHNTARQAFIEVGGVLQQAPAPRFSRSVPQPPEPPPLPGADMKLIAADWQLDPAIFDQLNP